MSAAKQDPHSGCVDQSCQVAGLAEGDLRAHVVCALLGRGGVPVVVVDQTELNLAGIDGLQDRAVTFVGHGVVGHEGVQPLGRGLLAIDNAHRRDEGEERRIAGGDADLSRPAGVQ